MTPLTLPSDPAQLGEAVARLWPDAARVCGVARSRFVAHADDLTGALYVSGTCFGPEDDRRRLLALERLAGELEGIGYAIRRDGSARVVLGWAAAYDSATLSGSHETGWWPTLRRLVDMEADPRGPLFAPSVVLEWRARLLRERQVRDRPTAPAENAKLEHARGSR